jgi:hypothetical protein
MASRGVANLTTTVSGLNSAKLLAVKITIKNINKNLLFIIYSN